MSMTSKVSPSLRANIIKSLTLSPKSNSGLFYSGVANPAISGSVFSLRAIQEATQKLTREGVLVATRKGTRTEFSVVNHNAVAATV